MSKINNDFIEFQDQHKYSGILSDVISDRRFHSLVNDSSKNLNGLGNAKIINEDLQTDRYLVWSDEFDGTESDTTKWHFEIFGSCWDNVHWNTNSPNNTNLSDGKLRIIARKDVPQTNDELEKSCDGINYYTSSYIVTQNKADWKYGRIEALIKLPDVGQGFVPAFWI